MKTLLLLVNFFCLLLFLKKINLVQIKNTEKQFNKLQYFFKNRNEKLIRKFDYKIKKIHRKKRKYLSKNLFKIPEYLLKNNDIKKTTKIKEKTIKLLPNFRFISFRQ